MLGRIKLQSLKLPDQCHQEPALNKKRSKNLRKYPRLVVSVSSLGTMRRTLTGMLSNEETMPLKRICGFTQELERICLRTLASKRLRVLSNQALRVLSNPALRVITHGTQSQVFQMFWHSKQRPVITRTLGKLGI